MVYENEIISRLRAAWLEIEEKQIEILEGFFLQLRDLDDKIAKKSPHELYESMWGLLGTMSRSYQLMLSAIDQIAGRNLNGFYVSARALVETLCSIIWASEKPSRFCNLVQFESLRIGRIMNAGYRKYPELKDVYSELSNIAHPNRGSHLLGPRPLEDRTTKGVFGPFNLDFSISFAKRMVHELTRIGPLINSELEELISSNDDIIRRGRLMGKVVNRSKDEV
jgi:hypothetical protein